MNSAQPIRRCPWVVDKLYAAYHDTEWGVPLHDDQKLFEFLILEGAQAGLSWHIILKKRENYRLAFDQFDPQKVARFNQPKVRQLLADSGIVRNHLKIAAAIHNAKAFLKVQEEFGSFNAYIWRFVDGQPIINRWRNLKELPVLTEESEALSRDLIQRGFKFVGSTICYAHMQATGMVNDHLVSCFRHKQLC